MYKLCKIAAVLSHEQSGANTLGLHALLQGMLEDAYLDVLLALLGLFFAENLCNVNRSQSSIISADS